MSRVYLLFVLTAIAVCDTLTYNELSDHAVDYAKKTVTFSFRYRGMRSHITPAIVNHGISEKKYVQLQANDLKLVLLVYKNSSVDKKLRKTKKNTSLVFAGKVKYWNARWGDKFYYVTITKVDINNKKQGATTEKQESTKSNDRSVPGKNPTLKELAQNPQNFLGQKIELSILYLKSTELNESYQRIWTLSRLPIVYKKKQKNINNILQDIQEKHPIKVSGTIQQIRIKNRQVYVMEIERVKASIKEIPRERFIRNRFRNRKN